MEFRVYLARFHLCGVASTGLEAVDLEAHALLYPCSPMEKKNDEFAGCDSAPQIAAHPFEGTHPSAQLRRLSLP